jgi:hypothetical protein
MFLKSQTACYGKLAPKGVFVEKFFKRPWAVVGVIALSPCYTKFGQFIQKIFVKGY